MAELQRYDSAQELQQEVEDCNALARECGYGQGELDDRGIGACLREHIDRLRQLPQSDAPLHNPSKGWD